jgi:hypothetical protein
MIIKGFISYQPTNYFAVEQKKITLALRRDVWPLKGG